ncbi:discoidin domain-containing protein [Paraglaciecola aestuariivivens]
MHSQSSIDIDFVKPWLVEHGFCLFKGLVDNAPLALEVNLDCRFLRFQLQGLTSFNLDKLIVKDKDGLNLVEHADIFVSSIYEDQARFDGQRLIHGRPTGGVNFHSKRETDPWIVLDFKQLKSIAKIEVYNRNDQFFHRALSLVVSHANDLQEWQLVFNNLAYKHSADYLALTQSEQALIDCGALDISAIKKCIQQCEKEADKESALAYLKAANALLSEHQLALGPHGLTQTFDLKSEQQKALIYSRLERFLVELNQEFGVDAFVSSGTLLGFVRHGELLGHDDDLDVCYISKAKSPEAILQEREAIIGFLTNKHYRVSHSDVAHLWVHTPDNLVIDLFTGWIDENKCLMNPLPLPGVAVEDVLPVQTMKSHGHTIRLPADPEALMELNYGKGWKTPDPLWKFDWSHARKLYDFLYFG